MQLLGTGDVTALDCLCLFADNLRRRVRQHADTMLEPRGGAAPQGAHSLDALSVCHVLLHHAVLMLPRAVQSVATVCSSRVDSPPLSLTPGC